MSPLHEIESLDFNIVQGCSALIRFCLDGNLFQDTYQLNYNDLNFLDKESIFLSQC